MEQQLKKQKIYFMGLGVLGLALVSSLVLLSLTNKEQEFFQGSTPEASLVECSLEQCSEEELAKKLKQIQVAIKKKSGNKPALKVSGWLDITMDSSEFKIHLDSLKEKLNQLGEASDKASKAKYNKYMEGLVYKLNMAKIKNIKKLQVSAFEKGDADEIKKYTNLNYNLHQIKFFFSAHRYDLSLSEVTEQKINSFLYDNSVDQALLSALVLEKQSRDIAEKAKENQSKNTDDLAAQIKSNQDISFSMNLHNQAQRHIFDLNQKMQRGVFNAAQDKWMLGQISKADQYVKSAEKLEINISEVNSKHTKPNTKKNIKKEPKYRRPSYENQYIGGFNVLDEFHGPDNRNRQYRPFDSQTYDSSKPRSHRSGSRSNTNVDNNQLYVPENNNRRRNYNNRPNNNKGNYYNNNKGRYDNSNGDHNTDGSPRINNEPTDQYR